MRLKLSVCGLIFLLNITSLALAQPDKPEKIVYQVDCFLFRQQALEKKSAAEGSEMITLETTPDSTLQIKSHKTLKKITPYQKSSPEFFQNLIQIRKKQSPNRPGSHIQIWRRVAGEKTGLDQAIQKILAQPEHELVWLGSWEQPVGCHDPVAIQGGDIRSFYVFGTIGLKTRANQIILKTDCQIYNLSHEQTSGSRFLKNYSKFESIWGTDQIEPEQQQILMDVPVYPIQGIRKMIKQKLLYLDQSDFAGLFLVTPIPHSQSVVGKHQIALEKSREQIPSEFKVVQQPDLYVKLGYANPKNPLGRVMASYSKNKLILTDAAAQALDQARIELSKKNSRYYLKILDGYRPMAASQELFKHQLIPSERSAYSRGSTIATTIIVCDSKPDSQQDFKLCQPLDMGSTWPKLSAHSQSQNSIEITQNRLFLKNLMIQAGFKPSANQSNWWEYTLNPEPFPETYFDFMLD